MLQAKSVGAKLFFFSKLFKLWKFENLQANSRRESDGEKFFVEAFQVTKIWNISSCFIKRIGSREKKQFF